MDREIAKLRDQDDIDADKIIDRADYINCSARCEGLNYVILGGEVVVEDAVYNGIRKGRFIQKEI